MEELETEVAGKSIPKEALEKTKEAIENSQVKNPVEIYAVHTKTTFILDHGFLLQYDLEIQFLVFPFKLQRVHYLLFCFFPPRLLLVWYPRALVRRELSLTFLFRFCSLLIFCHPTSIVNCAPSKNKTFCPGRFKYVRF